LAEASLMHHKTSEREEKLEFWGSWWTWFWRPSNNEQYVFLQTNSCV